MKNPRVKSLSNYFVGSVISSALNFLILYILINNFSFEKISEYVILLFVVNLLANANLFGQNTSIMRFYRGGADITKYKNNSLIIFISLSILIFVIFNVVIQIISINYSIFQDTFIANLIVVLAFSESFFRFILAHTISTQESAMNRKLFSIKALISISLISLYLLFDDSFFGLILCLILSNVIPILFFAYKQPYFLKDIKCDKGAIKELSLYSYPIFILAIFTLLSDYSNQIFLSFSKQNNESLAVYFFFLRAITLGVGALSVLNKVWMPIAMDNLFQRKTEVYSIMIKGMNIFIIIIPLSILASIGVEHLDILKYVLSDTYLDNFNIFIMLIPILMFHFIYLIISPIFYFEKKTIIFSIANIISSCIGIFFSFLLTSNFGLIGAVISVILSTIILLLILSVFYKGYGVFETIKKPFLFTIIFTLIHIIWISSQDYIGIYSAILSVMILLLVYKEKVNLKYFYVLLLR